MARTGGQPLAAVNVNFSAAGPTQGPVSVAGAGTAAGGRCMRRWPRSQSGCGAGSAGRWSRSGAGQLHAAAAERTARSVCVVAFAAGRRLFLAAMPVLPCSSPLRRPSLAGGHPQIALPRRLARIEQALCRSAVLELDADYADCRYGGRVRGGRGYLAASLCDVREARCGARRTGVTSPRCVARGCDSESDPRAVRPPARATQPPNHPPDDGGEISGPAFARSAPINHGAAATLARPRSALTIQNSILFYRLAGRRRPSARRNQDYGDHRPRPHERVNTNTASRDTVASLWESLCLTIDPSTCKRCETPTHAWAQPPRGP
ncbi:hypothetical protein BDV95DRAFT_593939 [Massariosphaeria phaeospora]|uniref:Uncharacterized protein n=1 Tax=Massariosphaeria phaeospora TaxID=100035 RepID=A0A7C8M9B4_9PLEO|nr:hypothetical protein BDV95DRAFT_593939 [Massariosphaeria phaeospora]